MSEIQSTGQGASVVLKNWQLIAVLAAYLFSAGVLYQQIQDVKRSQDDAQVAAASDRLNTRNDIENLRSEMERRYELIYDDFLKRTLK